MTHQRRPNENPPARRPVTLTRREKQIIRLVARGMSNKSVAQLLSISDATVHFHLKNIYRKLGVRNRTSATVFIVCHTLISES